MRCAMPDLNTHSYLPRPTAEQDAAYTSEWTAGIIDRPLPNAPATTLVAVRTAAREGFDRIVFEFDERVPGFHIEYIDRPVRRCRSGKVTQLAGSSSGCTRRTPRPSYSGNPIT